MLNRSSSGAKSRFVSQFPASSPTTLIPAWAIGSTATPPTAPRPTTTPSVSFNLVRMGPVSMLLEAGGGFGEHLAIVGGSMIRLQLLTLQHLLVSGRHRCANSWIPNQVPADEVRVAAVVRIAERSLDRVSPHHG